MEGKPIKPSEVHAPPVPSRLFDAFNDLIRETIDDDTATFALEDIFKQMEDIPKWRIVSWIAKMQPEYEKVGWIISLDERINQDKSKLVFKKRKEL